MARPGNNAQRSGFELVCGVWPWPPVLDHPSSGVSIFMATLLERLRYSRIGVFRLFAELSPSKRTLKKHDSFHQFHVICFISYIKTVSYSYVSNYVRIISKKITLRVQSFPEMSVLFRNKFLARTVKEIQYPKLSLPARNQTPIYYYDITSSLVHFGGKFICFLYAYIYLN